MSLERGEGREGDEFSSSSLKLSFDGMRERDIGFSLNIVVNFVCGGGGRAPLPEAKMEVSLGKVVERENIVCWLDGVQSIVELSYVGDRSEIPREDKSSGSLFGEAREGNGKD
jgi:hypothetical protein